MPPEVGQQEQRFHQCKCAAFRFCCTSCFAVEPLKCLQGEISSSWHQTAWRTAQPYCCTPCDRGGGAFLHRAGAVHPPQTLQQLQPMVSAWIRPLGSSWILLSTSVFLDSQSPAKRLSLASRLYTPQGLPNPRKCPTTMPTMVGRGRGGSRGGVNLDLIAPDWASGIKCHAAAAVVSASGPPFLSWRPQGPWLSTTALMSL